LKVIHHGELASGNTPLPLPIQAELRSLLKREEVDTSNVRRGMDDKQVARFWSFIRGRSAKRDITDLIVASLKDFLTLLTDPNP
jgi:hypothetical protein